MKSSTLRNNLGIKFIFLHLIMVISVNGFGQNTSSIRGKIMDEKTNKPVPFATIRLSQIPNDTTHTTEGAMSDDNGNFSINQLKNGSYTLQVTSVGYKTAVRRVDITSAQNLEIGTILLGNSPFTISETVVVADRIKGKSEANKTIYYISSNMLNATGSAPELLRQIPGVRVDLKHNISLNGNSDILLYVDGKEHDKSYISQLTPSEIDKIEVLNTPPSNYDGNVSGIINIILKKEKRRGLSGNFFSEIPPSKDIVYLFPTYALNYNYNKINVYTSYNGEINYEKIDEVCDRQIMDKAAINIHSIQKVRQKNLSHKFHYGIDYYLTPKDIFNFYGFYNWYSYEQDGDVFVDATGKDIWTAQKNETDKNHSFLHSLYYKHQFKDERKELTVDISNAHLRSKNNVAYMGSAGNQNNHESPQQNTTSAKVDFTTPFNDKLQISIGFKTKFQSMRDETSNGFCFNEQIYAGYGSLNYKHKKYYIQLGIRLEDSETELNKQSNNSTLSALPYFSINYKANTYSDFSLTYRHSANRPSVYYLNPYSYSDNPYTLREGNPLLNPEFRSRLQLEYSTRFKTNFISTQLFYETTVDAINNLSYVKDNTVFVIQPQNLGDLHQYGLQLKAALKFGILSISPYASLYVQSTYGNKLAQDHAIKNKTNLVFASGLSSLLSFKNDLALSAIFQYSTAIENIQDSNYSDALYFISLDKTFKNKLKVGIISALPLVRTFIYQGSNIHSSSFTSKYAGNLKLPAMPFMFRITYQFNIGKDRNKMNREKEDLDTKPKQGF
ncbi:MAG: hypothetical protein BGN96_17850 [Bacteroidales bacterium 45-6]|nr:MAG: hypothetical protein BGN96_17850 [Bacteroidales bacterium 45-6]